MIWSPGQTLQAGKYRILRQIGGGGFGLTYLAEDCQLQRQVVIKAPNRTFEADQDYEKFIRRFQREGQALAKISHPNVVQVIELCQEGGMPCLVMAYVEGETLNQRIRRQGRISQDEALPIFRKLATTLHHLHQQKIIHCDLHPGNIILRPDSEPVLIDFGSVKLLQPSTHTVTTTTNDFSAYEHGKPGSQPQPRWDIYALAATLYFAVTGQKPEAAINRKLYGDTLKPPQKLRPDLSAWCNQAIVQGMALEAADRPATMQAWLTNLQPPPPKKPDKQRELDQQRELRRQQELASQQELKHQRQFQPQPTQSDSRRRFLHQAGWAGTGLVVVGLGETARRMFFAPKPSPSPSPTSTASQPLAPQSVSFKVVAVDAKGKPMDTQTKQGQQWADDLGNGVKLELMQVPAGSFMMGTADSERNTVIQETTRYNISQEDAEKWTNWQTPQHKVTVPSFWMGRYPVTQGQYQAIMGENPSNFKGDNRPVEGVTWHQAVEFCKRLSARTGQEHRLPSEAEWEYACRAGTTTPFYFGPTITPELVNYNSNFPYGNAAKGEYRQQTTDVGSFPPNAFGLYDMHGNVWEWCSDPWHENYNNAPNDGSVWNIDGSDSYRVLRGGSWIGNAWYCRSAYRVRLYPDGRFNNNGFRVVVGSLVVRTP